MPVQPPYTSDFYKAIALKKVLAMIDKAQDDVDYWIDDLFTISHNGLPSIDDAKRVKRELDSIAYELGEKLDLIK